MTFICKISKYYFESLKKSPQAYKRGEGKFFQKVKNFVRPL